MAGGIKKEFEHVTVESREALRAWLTENHTRRESIWLVRYKKGSAHGVVEYSDIVDEALCFGWIDSHVRKVDDQRTKLLLSPRQRGSGWSKVNKEKVQRLVAQGLMTPAGQAVIDAAKADGSWDALNDVNALVIPADLESALRATPNAWEHFNAFSPSSRRGILEWIHTAKRPETRAKRIEETARLASQNRKANHPGEK